MACINKNETVQFWEGIKIKDENENKLSMGTLMMWAKNCDKNIYNMMTFNPFFKKSDMIWFYLFLYSCHLIFL